MSAAALQSGDQVVLEEDYDENYVPTETEVKEYAKEIGIDPDKEPALMWLARDGIMARLPKEWKPCQDVSGEIYYFNFSTGQSTWDHPCDEQYRNLVIKERAKLQVRGQGQQKKEKKKKKEKKEPTVSTLLAPVHVPPGALSPLRASVEPFIAGGNGAMLEPLRTSGRMSSLYSGEQQVATSGPGNSLLRIGHGEKVSLSLPGFDEEEDKDTDQESLLSTGRLLQNLHVDVTSLGCGFEYEDSESVDKVPHTVPLEEPTEPELQDLVASEDEGGGSIREGSVDGTFHSSPSSGSRASTPTPALEEAKEACGAKETLGVQKGRLIEMDETGAADTRGEEQCDLQEPDSHEGTKKKGMWEADKERQKRAEAAERRLRESLQQGEEEAVSEKLSREKEDRLRNLKEQLEKEFETKEKELREESHEKLEQLKAKMKAEAEEMEQNLRQQHQEELKKVQFDLDADFDAQKAELLEKHEKEMEEERSHLNTQWEHKLEEMRSSLDKERKEALTKLEKQHSEELQELRNTMEESHKKEISNLQKQLSEEQSSERDQADVLETQRRVQQVSEYEKTLTDLLQEKRLEVEREHEAKLEQLREEHRAALEHIREEHQEEEQKQRASLLAILLEERERLLANQSQEMNELRTELERQLQEMRQAYDAKEAHLQDLEDQLDLKARELNTKSGQLQCQEELLRKKMKELNEEEEQFAKEDQKNKHEKIDALQDTIRSACVEVDRLQEKKISLESEVELLQDRKQRLHDRVRELEKLVDRKQESLRAIGQPDQPVTGQEEEALRADDLKAGTEEQSPPQNLDDVRHYVSSQGVSLQKARQFLDRQTSSLRRRQEVLRLATRQENDDPLESDGSLQDFRSHLKQELNRVSEMKAAMQKSQMLLLRKEERLSQLESSLHEEISDEDSTRGKEDKKVTFDLSDTDLSSVDSEDLPLAPEPLESPSSKKVHYLNLSLQRISQELNKVLGALGSMGQHQSTLFSRPEHPPRSFVAAAATAPNVDQMLADKWIKYFPGGIPEMPSAVSPFASTIGYQPASERLRRMRMTLPKNNSAEQQQRLQSLIRSNKKWLETFKKDPKVPLLTRSVPTPGSGLLQLGLDENNQIKVYRY
ncbi:centrosomal protein of 164 kDa isoform X2 [Erpetoichthys calabaricus]|nr:centrosomal protein of 164 kDa isoform X2 [Erpetoichthys calabaricus]